MHVDVDSTGWAHWRLACGGTVLELGEDGFDGTGPRVVDRLTHRHEPAGELDGEPVQWVCAFGVHHYTIYCRWSDAERVLMFQDGSGQIRWRDTLTESQLKEWTDTIRLTLGASDERGHDPPAGA
jgi:hypothetical protein